MMGKPIIIYKKKLRSFINFIATEIFRDVIKSYKDKSITFEFNYNEAIIDLKVSIRFDLTIDQCKSLKFDIDGSSSDEDITMNIHLFKSGLLKTSYNDFHAEAREFLRHEMEHLGQYYGVSNKVDIYGHPTPTTLSEYLIQPYEIDAFLHGLNYKRKYLKTNINDEIDYLIKNYYNIQDTNIFNIIKEKWIDRLKEILPHTL
jgi:hypothetical protein